VTDRKVGRGRDRGDMSEIWLTLGHGARATVQRWTRQYVTPSLQWQCVHTSNLHTSPCYIIYRIQMENVRHCLYTSISKVTMHRPDKQTRQATQLLEIWCHNFNDYQYVLRDMNLFSANLEKKLERCGYLMVKKSDKMFSHFDRILVCDGRTDGHLATA